MYIEECIDFSEILDRIACKYSELGQGLGEIALHANIRSCSRIYFGSSFCGQYFMHLKPELLTALREICLQRNIKLSVVLPTFTEKNLHEGKEKLKAVLLEMGTQLDEIVVNDYGMLAYVNKEYPNKHLVMGRLFAKDYREPRYPEYFNQVYYPKIFNAYLIELIKKYNISGMLFDATHHILDFSEKPADINIGIYEPYTYITTGQICEIGSTHLPIEKKFRPNAACGKECQTQKLQYFIDEHRKWVRVGRTIYFENRDFTVQGIEKLKRIYVPFDQEVIR